MTARSLLTAAILALAAAPAAAGLAGDQLCREAGRSAGCIGMDWPRDSYRPPRERDDRGSSVPSGCPECRAETIRRLGHFTVLRPPAWTTVDQRRVILRSIWREEWGVGLDLGPLLTAKPPARALPPPPSPLDPLRAKIAEVAKTHVGQEDWAFDRRRAHFGRRKNKCNLFVAEAARKAGAHVPSMRGRLKIYPPTAEDWANQDLDIEGWSRPFTKGSKPGDVVAIAHRYSDATGHVGIVVEGRMSVSADSTAEVPGTIRKTQFGFRPSESPKFRRYVGIGE